jgi:1-hydroxy-2-isopentenylcarotenoid 3,4-desaturase
VKELFGPNDFKTKYYSWQSSMLGQSHVLKQSAFFRTPNVSKKLSNLYYVGGNTTPGIGLPMCLIGAELVYKRIMGNKKGGRVESIEAIS